MTIRIVALAALLGLAFSSYGAEPQPRGFYAGAMGGSAEFDDDDLFDGLNFDDEDVGYAGFAGYKILKYLAVEARVSYLGNYKLSGFAFSEDFDVTAVSAHVVGIIPFGTSGWEIFGQLGVGSAQIDCDDCDDQTVGSAGLGVRFFPTSHLGITLQTDAFAYEEDDFGGTYDIGIATTQLGLLYIF